MQFSEKAFQKLKNVFIRYITKSISFDLQSLKYLLKNNPLSFSL